MLFTAKSFLFLYVNLDNNIKILYNKRMNILATNQIPQINNGTDPAHEQLSGTSSNIFARTKEIAGNFDNTTSSGKGFSIKSSS